MPSELTEDLLEYGPEVNSYLFHKIVTAVVRLLYVSALNDADVELVEVGHQGVVNSFLELGDVLLSSELSDDWEAGVLNVKDRFVDTLDVVLRNLHPGESTETSVLSGQVGLLPTLVQLQILFVWVDGCSFNHLIYIFYDFDY